MKKEQQQQSMRCMMQSKAPQTPKGGNLTEYICIKCGYEGRRKAIKPGSTAMEVLLWVTLLIPGPFYTLWRILCKKYICPMCEESTMRDINSPLGRRKLEMLEQEISGKTPEFTPQQPSPKEGEDTATPASHTENEDEAPSHKAPQTPKPAPAPPDVKSDEW